MAKDKTRTIVFRVSVMLPNGSRHHFHFRKSAHASAFLGEVIHIDGVSDAREEPCVYVYEGTETPINMVLNFTSNLAPKDRAA